jgi:hypothetical protein
MCAAAAWLDAPALTTLGPTKPSVASAAAAIAKAAKMRFISDSPLALLCWIP